MNGKKSSHIITPIDGIEVRGRRSEVGGSDTLRQSECKCKMQSAKCKMKITNTKFGRGDPSPTTDEPTHPFSIQGEGLVYHQRSCISSRAGVHIITAGAYHQRSCIKTERKRNKAKPSDIILYSIFNIHYSFIKITTPKNGRGDPLPYDRRTDSPVLNPRRRLGISSAKLYIITRRRAYHHRRCISSAKLYKNRA